MKKLANTQGYRDSLCNTLAGCIPKRRNEESYEKDIL
ncbi:hypothetical protein HDF15_000890 [Granulicella mallensis]|jgi:hypothetical protein|uniref:Uncharacterized protein n=1 Tax=Granulicella mallensis TaxID=940614 RepID=A0A7W7ZMB2_9BACT|nr:hypothetical protein [Granulicella mallensis]